MQAHRGTLQPDVKMAHMIRSKFVLLSLLKYANRAASRVSVPLKYQRLCFHTSGILDGTTFIQKPRLFPHDSQSTLRLSLGREPNSMKISARDEVISFIMRTLNESIENRSNCYKLNLLLRSINKFPCPDYATESSDFHVILSIQYFHDLFQHNLFLFPTIFLLKS